MDFSRADWAEMSARGRLYSMRRLRMVKGCLLCVGTNHYGNILLQHCKVVFLCFPGKASYVMAQ
jgi:hypothetical protein